MAALNLAAFFEQLRSLPKVHKIRVGVASPVTVDLIHNELRRVYGKSVELNFFGMHFEPCQGLEDDDVLFFETHEDSDKFIKAMVMARQADIDIKALVRAFKREFVERAGGGLNDPSKRKFRRRSP